MSNNQVVSWDVTVSSLGKTTLGAGDSIALDILVSQFKWSTTDDDAAVIKKEKLLLKILEQQLLQEQNGVQIQLKITVKKEPTKLKVKNAPEKLQVGKKVTITVKVK